MRQAEPGGAVSQRACVFCGSRVVLYPITDALHIVHGPIGCAAYTWDIRGALSSGPQLHRHSFSTDLREMDVIQGGEKETLRGAVRTYRRASAQGRAGNAALEQVVMALRCSLQLGCGINSRKLAALCSLVAEATGRPIPDDRPITGQSVFLHESGIHCSGLLQSRDTYELFAAEDVGCVPPDLVMGKHSGTATIVYALAKQGIRIEREKALAVLQEVRVLAMTKKGPVMPAELMKILHDSRAIQHQIA